MKIIKRTLIVQMAVDVLREYSFFHEYVFRVKGEGLNTKVLGI